MLILARLLLLSALWLAGCAIHDGRPFDAAISTPPQGKLKSAAHWQIVATDIATQIEITLRQQGLAQTAVNVPGGQAGGTKFSSVFASQLRSSLLQHGLKVTDSAAAPLQVAVSTEAVWHGNFRHLYKPGTYTALGTGVMVLRDVLLKATDPWALSGLAAAVDVSQSIDEFAGRPFTEIVLTTSMQQDGVFLLHRSDVYYVDEVDTALFETEPQRPFKVVGERP